jgi:hypothetical protein
VASQLMRICEARSYLLRAFVLWLVQLALVWIVAGSFEALSTWDGGWYLNILENGYQSPFPRLSPENFGNVAFFPGLPVAAGLMHRFLNLVLEVSHRESLVVTAQLAALIFHLILFWGLDRVLLLGRRAQWIAGAIWALQPGAFFLFVGYSESLFLCSAALLSFGFLKLLVAAKPVSWTDIVALAAAGIVITGTRLVGVVFCFVGLWLWTYFRSRRAPDASRARVALILGITVFAMVGAGTFFAYCQWRFGAWDLYFKTLRTGWEFLPSFEWSRFLHFLFWKGMFPLSSGNGLGRLELFAIFALALYFYFQRRRYSQSAVALSSFGGLFALATLALISSGRLGGFIRYLLPSVFLLIPAATEWVELYSSPWQKWMLALAGVLLLVIQISFVSWFGRTLWVA